MHQKIENDLTQKFSKPIIFIHWLSAIMIFGLFALGLSISNLEGTEKLALLPIHATGGFILFILTVIRSVLFFKSKRPDDLKTGSKFNDKLAVWIHNILYIFILLIGISGIVTMLVGGYGDALDSGDWKQILDREVLPSLKAHVVLSYLMMGLVFMHIVGVIKHYLLTKENTLKRIW